MHSSKRLLQIFTPLIILISTPVLLISLSKRSILDRVTTAQPGVDKIEVIRLKEKSQSARTFARQNDYNSRTCFLVDMALPSGHNRFFVYDLEKDSVKSSNLVAHGRCNQNWLEGRKYGNTIGCGCTSLGKYKIGQPYEGRFGQAYKLYGLESSNSNAFARYVVLHSYYAMPDNETEDDICQSDGCPMVSKKFLEELKAIIDASKKPMLLWIFD